MSEYLIESALLTHGLKSITNEMLLSVWKKREKRIVWMESGKIQTGEIQEYCTFREKSQYYARINYQNFQHFQREKKSGILTASGTMRACEILGIPLAVTCGMGGLMQGQHKEDCHDILALAESTVSLVAVSPKDMFDLKVTLDGIKSEGIQILGYDTDVCSGYMFRNNAIPLSRIWKKEPLYPKTLYLREIPDEKRIKNHQILEKACAYGIEREKEGHYYHPAVNAKIDELTNGKSSKIQLEALIKNIEWAEKL